MSIDISVVICCYNSASRIEPTLKYLALQELDGLSCEVVLVDNNCSDDTVKISINKWEEFGSPFPLRIIEEKEPGLSFARKAGVMEAKGEFLIFCDDDNWLDKDYCRIAFEIMQSDQSIGVLGGRGIAVSDVEFPFWFNSYQSGYAVGVQSIQSGFVDDRGYLWGAGMTIRKEELLRLYNSGFVSLLTGRIGQNLNSGEDSEICKWFLLVGKRLFYSEDLIYRHYIEATRLNKEYLKKLYDGFSDSVTIIYFYNDYVKCKKADFKMSIYKIFLLHIRYILRKATTSQLIMLELNHKNKWITYHIEASRIKEFIKSYQSNS